MKFQFHKLKKILNFEASLPSFNLIKCLSLWITEKSPCVLIKFQQIEKQLTTLWEFPCVYQYQNSPQIIKFSEKNSILPHRKTKEIDVRNINFFFLFLPISLLFCAYLIYWKFVMRISDYLFIANWRIDFCLLFWKGNFFGFRLWFLVCKVPGNVHQ